MKECGVFFRVVFNAIQVCFAISLGATSAYSAQIEVEISDLRPVFPLRIDIEISGPIEIGDADLLQEILGTYHGHYPREISVSFDSPGGVLVEGLAIGSILLEESVLVTSVVGTLDNPNAECASACVLAYLGADLRYIGEAGRIGVHQFSGRNSGLSADDALNIAQRLSSAIVAFVRSQQVDTEFFDRMVSTEPDAIDWVDREQLEEWRVVTGPFFNETINLHNVEGYVGVQLLQEGRFGVNQMTLFCGEGPFVVFAALDEPELAMMGDVAFVLDGIDHIIDNYELVNREGNRTRVFFQIPDYIVGGLMGAGTLGAKVITPGGDLFWGFQQRVRGDQVEQLVQNCLNNSYYMGVGR